MNLADIPRSAETTSSPLSQPAAHAGAHAGQPTTLTDPLMLRVPHHVALLGAMGLPVLSLGVQGGANTAYFVMLLAAVWGAATLAVLAASPQSPSWSIRPWWRYRAGVSVALASPLLAVAWNQLVTGDFSDRAFDGMSRLLLASVLAWWLCQLPAERLRHWQWALILGVGVGVGMMLTHIPAGETRPDLDFATAITFGNLTLLMGAMAFLTLGWQITRHWLEPVVKVLAGVLGVYGSLLSQSRGGWLALPAMILVLLLVLRLSWRVKVGVLVLTAVALGGAWASSPVIQERVELAAIELQDYAEGHNLESSIGMRMQFWQASWEMFREAPLTGVGSQNINAEFRERVARGEMAPLGASYNHSHNEWFWFMASLGVPGIMALLAVYLVPFAAFVQAARSQQPIAGTAGRMGVVVVTAYATFGLTEAMFAITMNVAFYAGSVAILLAICHAASVPRQLATRRQS